LNFDFHFFISNRTAVTFINTDKAFIAKTLWLVCQENLFRIFGAKGLTTDFTDYTDFLAKRHKGLDADCADYAV
jgi:hypothetical protein